ncbi:hypothetical protein E0H73_14715 [Kribbella pittospori]|uniref:Uncharacterized protein n=1 Tax=Kribbella pittospori TaxID=722689 RepID=A0A4R0KRD1_9ACTN|nr:hypothetical protein [Kribbella pittospori]TCC61974.1 hypothetical protein E0H73_14715 [Kribbella pittospori]
MVDPCPRSPTPATADGGRRTADGGRRTVGGGRPVGAALAVRLAARQMPTSWLAVEYAVRRRD